MIPLTVKYHNNYEFDPSVVFRCRVSVPIPASWIRLSFPVSEISYDVEWHLRRWIDENLSGNYIINVNLKSSGLMVSLGFEDTTTAVMFRLLGGETAWQESISVF